MISLWHYLAVGAVLFGLGMVGFLTRRNLITMFLSAELMLQGVVLNLLAFSRFHANLSGQAFALFVITVAACEAGIAMALFIITVAACEAGLALALFLTLYRQGKTLDSGDWQSVREAGIPATVDSEPLRTVVEEPDPVLTPAGLRPVISAEIVSAEETAGV